MNNTEKQTVLHCLKSMIDEEVCEECPLYGTTGTDHCEKDCVRLAINALEQEPCTDAISRQAAKDMLKARAKFLMDTYHEPTDLEMIKLIDELPPVTPAEKVGHWIYDRTKDWDGECKYECSECGMGSDVDYAYCMRCGAKMQEVEE